MNILKISRFEGRKITIEKGQGRYLWSSPYILKFLFVMQDK